METPRSLISYDRSTAWRVVLLGVAALAFAAMEIGFNWKLLGGPPPISLFYDGFWWPLDGLAALFVIVLMLWVFLTMTGVALIPILIRAELARVLMLSCLLLLVVTSLIAWTKLWPEQWWDVPQSIAICAIGNALLTTLCLFQYHAWRKDPEGPARRRLPLALQLWLQTLWIPWPLVDMD